MIGIYKIVSPTSRVYIGQSVDIEKRWNDYKSGHCKYQRKLKNSIEKYGVDNHSFVLVEECDTHTLNKRERYYQEKYDSVKNGLNCRYTKTDNKSGFICKETRERMSEGQKGRVSYWKGKKRGKYTDEHRKKISTALSGKPSNVVGKILYHNENGEHRYFDKSEIPNSNIWIKGRSKESKEKISNSKIGTTPWNKGKKMGKQFSIEMSKRMKGVPKPKRSDLWEKKEYIENMYKNGITQKELANMLQTTDTTIRTIIKSGN